MTRRTSYFPKSSTVNNDTHNTMTDDTTSAQEQTLIPREYQIEMLNESLKRNIIIALDTGSGKTHIAVLRLKHEAEREPRKISWFLVPTVALAQQQQRVIKGNVPVPVGLISGAEEPDQWKDRELWRGVLIKYRIIVSTPDVLLNALRHGYVHLGRNIGFLVFDEAHHAADRHAYNLVMQEFYTDLPPRMADGSSSDADVRPMILGLTASPIFGGNAERSLRQIERNLDATVCTPVASRSELEGYVHRPTFKHVIYAEPEYMLVGPPPSSNLRSLQSVLASLKIAEDPWVIEARKALKRLEPGPERTRLDQRLSRAMDKHDTFAHKGLRDFERAAMEICSDLGAWAADWYVGQVCEQAVRAGEQFPEFCFTSTESERRYLLNHLARVEIAPVPEDEDDADGAADLLRRTSDKVDKLVETLLEEKAFFEGNEQEYRGLVFVTRRDAVLALTAVLMHHPLTKDAFTVGSLLGASGDSRRRTFLDITRRLLRLPASETLGAFSIGELNLIVATAVAEEGLDIQACCNVVRWDPPANMVSWTQSRGRARKQHSSFIVMLSDSRANADDVRKWEELELKMTKLYNTSQEHRALLAGYEDDQMDEDDDDNLRFTVEATGAVLTGNSAIEHIVHFCAILPSSGHNSHSALFDIDPPEYPFEWHADQGPRETHPGPFGCALTLPKLVPPHCRNFSTPQIHSTRLQARRHVAFQAYRALYDNDLLNEHLLPLTSVLEPDMESEVRALLKDVEQRNSTERVSSQMDPWSVSEMTEERLWHSTILEVDGLPPLRLLTQTALPSFRDDELPVLHTRESPPFKVCIRTEGTPIVDDGILGRARTFTRRFFWPLYGSRMKWDQTDFVHLFLPVDESPTVWDERRAALASDPVGGPRLFAPFPWWEQRYGHIDDFPVTIVTDIGSGSKPFHFIRWKGDPVTEEEMGRIKKRYMRGEDDGSESTFDIEYPLIEARSFSKRNFLTPMPAESKGLDAGSQKPDHLLKRLSLVALISSQETQYALWAPSVIRHLQMASTASSIRDNLFAGTPLADIPLHLLLEATTAPVAQERSNYQRLETLGDTVLKYTVSIQLLSAHPLWHEGYLARRKDHAVSNANLSKMAIEQGLNRWITRDSLVPKRWRPRLASDLIGFLHEETPAAVEAAMTEKEKRKASAARNLSTKVLADVVEALIGASYLHGGFALGTECLKVFNLGLSSWNALPDCIEAMYVRTSEFKRYPEQITTVESILGYTFRRKAIAVEALVHSSYQSDLETISYERMEFLGDAVLDMLVTDYLFHAPGKNYTPGQMHMIKTAVVNAHFLAMLCLRASTPVPVSMPKWSREDGVTMNHDTQHTYLWQCLLHSSLRVMDEQRATFVRWERPGGREDEIEAALAEGKTFPWSALTSLQAPKFLSDMFESLLGAVYLDSLGDLDATREVLRRLGHWEVLERIVACDMDIQHPVSRLYLWASKHHEHVKCATPRKDGKFARCSVYWDDFEFAEVGDHEWRGRISLENARFAAAEKAIALLEDPVELLHIWLAKRKRSIQYSMDVVDGVPVCVAVIDGTHIAKVQSSGRCEEETKQAAAKDALKILEVPVHWLTFLAVQHGFEVEYQIYEEEESEVRVCCVLLDGREAGRAEFASKLVVTEGDMTAAAAKEAIEFVDRLVLMNLTTDDWDFEGEEWA